ncbi:MAG: glycosyltransferase family 4 protein [Armatimonadetes bacterium]|nr:glycosyltransferase family 4 protein [Armatimonadota bacterium]
MMTLAGQLREQGQEVTFATFRGRGLGEATRALGYPTSEVSVRLKIDPIGIAQLVKMYKRTGVDVVHSHLSTSSVNGSIAARLARLPSVATVHGMSGKKSFLAAHHLIAVSSEVRSHLIAQGVHESKISIVPNGIVMSSSLHLPKKEARKKLGIPADGLVLGTTARLTSLKGVDHALYAVARVAQDFPNVHYVVFGDGEDHQRLAEICQSLRIEQNVHWMGYREDVQALLPALDLFLFPSLREAMGISIVEALAAGLPVVATKIGGIPEVVTKACGTLVPPADPVAMADAVSELLRDPVRRMRMSEEAWQRATSEFSAQRMAARTLGVYAAVLERHRNA